MDFAAETDTQGKEADVARYKPQLIIPLLETGSESTAQPQPQKQQQPEERFETEGKGKVVDAGK